MAAKLLFDPVFHLGNAAALLALQLLALPFCALAAAGCLLVLPLIAAVEFYLYVFYLRARQSQSGAGSTLPCVAAEGGSGGGQERERYNGLMGWDGYVNLAKTFLFSVTMLLQVSAHAMYS